MTDHLPPHKGDMVLFWDASKWQAACYWHHDVVKQMLELSFATGSIDEAALWLDSDAAKRLTERLVSLP